MRQLKFRIWDLQSKRFVNNDCGTHCCSNWMIDAFTGELCDMVQSIGHEGFTRSDDSGYLEGSKYHKKKYVIQQFTGLKDRNGQEIYEGDVVRFVTNTEEHIAKVFYSELEGVMYPTHEGRCVLEDNAVVIGNIFENPEILQKQ